MRNWIKKWGLYVLILSIFCLAIGSVYYWPEGFIRKTFGLKEQELPKIVKVDNRNPEVEQRIVDWVYDHSTRTSRRMAKDWVDGALKTNKPLLILAVSMQESEFNPTAVSDKGAKGGTQVMWKYWGPELVKAGICPSLIRATAS